MINAKIREFENDIINYANLCEDVPIEANPARYGIIPAS